MSTPCVPRADLCIYQGDDYAALVTVLNANGTPADLTGYVVQAQIRRNTADVETEIAATINTLVSVNTITLAIPHDVTATLNGKYVWDLQLTSEAGMVTTILAGKANVTAEVTRPGVGRMRRAYAAD